MSCYEYLNALENLVKNSPGQVIVSHEPMSERYQRAAQYIEDFLNDGRQLGFKILKEDGPSKHIEIALFIQPSTQAPGEYGAFRLLIEEDEAYFAELFAFYDNAPSKEDTGNKAVKNLNEAMTLMRSYGYEDCES